MSPYYLLRYMQNGVRMAWSHLLVAPAAGGAARARASVDEGVMVVHFPLADDSMRTTPRCTRKSLP